MRGRTFLLITAIFTIAVALIVIVASSMVNSSRTVPQTFKDAGNDYFSNFVNNTSPQLVGNFNVTISSSTASFGYEILASGSSLQINFMELSQNISSGSNGFHLVLRSIVYQMFYTNKSWTSTPYNVSLLPITLGSGFADGRLVQYFGYSIYTFMYGPFNYSSISFELMPELVHGSYVNQGSQVTVERVLLTDSNATGTAMVQ